MTVAYASQAAGVDSKVTINSGAIATNAKNLQSNIDSASRILYEANVNVNSNISSVALMMPAGGLQITKNIDLTNYQGKWVNLKIYYQPLMTYAYTVDGIQKSFSTSIMREEGYSSYTADFWKTLLSDSAANDTYDSTKTYVLKSAVYGNCEAYINGNLVLNSNYPMPSRQSYSTSTIPTRFVFWAADNAKAKTVYYSNIKHSIISNYSSDVQSMSPFTNESKDGNMVQVDYNTNSTISLTTKTAGNTVKLFLIDGFGNLKPLAENVEIAVK